MISSFLVFLYALFVLLIQTHSAPDKTKVELRVNITASRLMLHCEVSENAMGTTTHLYCPIIKNSPCFLDCVRSCILIENKCKSLEELKTTYCSQSISNGIVTTSYTLDAKDRKNKGEWYCVHGGKRSSGFFLNVDKLMMTTTTTTPKPTTTLPTTTTTVKTTTTTSPSPALLVSRTSPRAVQYERKDTEKDLMPVPKEDGINDFIKQLTRPDLVIAILSLLAISLIVNLAFCIRCILVRRYIEIQRCGEKDSPCLSACLCISRSQPNKAPPKAPRDCIYEEITTSPGTMGRLARPPSNCSSTQRTFSTSLDGTDRGTFVRRGSMPRSRTFPVKAVALPAQGLHQRPSYIYVAATENGMLLEPVLTPASRVSSQQLVYDDVASDGLQSLHASTNAIYAKVQKATQQLQHRQALHELQQQQLQQQQMARKPSDSLPPPLAEQQEDELTPLTGSPAHSVMGQRVTPVNRPGSASTTSGTESRREKERGANSLDNLDVAINGTRNDSRLEMSKSLLQKADTLLREAGCLLD